MRIQHSILSLLSLLPLCVPSVVEGAEAQNTNDEPSLAAMVQDALSLEQPTGDFLIELAGALSALSGGKPPREVDQAIRVLSDRASRGARIDSFTPLLVEQLTVSSAGEKIDKNWRYGTHMDRHQLRTHLWNKAVSMAERDPATARVFARAAIVLSGHEGLTIGGLSLRVFGQDAARMKRVAQLDQRQSKVMESLVSLLNEEINQRTKPLFAVFEAEATLIEDGRRPLPWELVQNSIQAITEYRRIVQSMKGPRFSEQFDVAWASWHLRNLVIAYGDDKSKLAVDATLEQWRADARSTSPQRRWMDEAMTLVEKPLTRSRIAGPGKTGQAPLQNVERLRRVGRVFQNPLGLTALALIGAILCFTKWRFRRRGTTAHP